MKNEYKVFSNYVDIFMKNRLGKVFITKVSKKHLERLLNLNVRWHPDWKPKIKDYYAQATIYQGVLRLLARNEET